MEETNHQIVEAMETKVRIKIQKIVINLVMETVETTTIVIMMPIIQIEMEKMATILKMEKMVIIRKMQKMAIILIMARLELIKMEIQKEVKI
jgi:hypothetical protein